MAVTSVIPASNKFSESMINGYLSDFAAAQEADNETMRAVKNHFKRPAGLIAISHTGFLRNSNTAALLSIPERLYLERRNSSLKITMANLLR